MANAKEINRKKITKAMELISTVKMKKAQDLALEKREFVLEILKVFLRVEEYLSDYPLFDDTKTGKTLAVVVTSNKGLCGGYNINVMKKVNEYAKANPDEKLEFITVGKKAAGFVARTGNTLLADFSEDFGDNIEPIFTKRISKMMRDEFMTGEYAKVVVFYNHYVNTIKQIPVAETRLPINAADIKDYLTSVIADHYDLEQELGEKDDTHFYDIEPSSEEVANEVIPIILDMIFYDVLLESKASEHSSRMIAMKNAKDSAKKIADELTLQYNKARQALITREVSEITAGVESLKDA